MMSTNLQEELYELLTEFVIKVIEEKPLNLINFAANYFKNIESFSTAEPFNFLKKRRKSISAEPYDPEKDKNYKKIIIKKSKIESERLDQLIRSINIFQSLDNNQVKDIVQAMSLKKVIKNEIVIKQHAEGDFFYIIEKGVYEAYTNENPKKHIYDNFGYFGELALLYNQPRAATVVSKTDGKLWCVDRKTFRQIVLQNAFQKRKQYETMLGKCDLLKNQTSYERMSIADALTDRSFNKGDCIIKQNDTADCMYFLVSGEAEVYIGDKGKSVKVCKAGDYFGELALLNNKPRAASVYAKTDVNTAILPKDAFERLIGSLRKRQSSLK
jgi:cAMP-dependent protein kinase regulator